MSKIINFPSSKNTNEVTFDGQSLDEIIMEELTKTPKKVNDLLNTPIKDIAKINESKLRELIIDYIFNKLNKDKTKITTEIGLTTNYISSLLLDMMLMKERGKNIVNTPYTNEWIAKGNWQMAGDVGVYGFLNFYKSRKNFLKQSDYLDIIYSSYHMFGKKIDDVNLAGNTIYILPMIQNIGDDFFRRGVKIVK